MKPELVFSVSDFVAVFNQTIEYAYPSVTISGELANFRVSKNRWVYFDLKDELASVKFFGSVYVLPGPLEEGMVLKVTGTPRLHQQFGFSISMSSIQLAGEGTIKKAAQLLRAKLEKEGLFDLERKRVLPYPPQAIGLITSGESAAYADFVKIIKGRWGGITIKHYDVQVQGEAAPAQITHAIDYFNSHASPVDVLVVTRGGGSSDDLQAFSSEMVTRATAGSRIPTLVAVGHEIDISLAELAADVRASTPSNAAELLVPDKATELRELHNKLQQSRQLFMQTVELSRKLALETKQQLNDFLERHILRQQEYLQQQQALLAIVNPQVILRRGYAIVRSGDKAVRSVKQINKGDQISVQVGDGDFGATVS